MLFNSIEFLIFLPIVYLIYWLVFNGKNRQQNVLLLVASYLFYGWWDWRFLFLIFLSSCVDYIIGLRIEKANSKKALLFVSLAVNLGLLGVFKYFNFFSDSLESLFLSFGYQLDAVTLNLILPVGISFYTFQTLSYTIDVYRGRITPCKDPFAFFAFVSFFPQLVAGPIERASNLLPQFDRLRNFDTDESREALRIVLWGLFKKVVIADSCGVIVDEIFSNGNDHSGSTLLMGAVFFAFQIYGDFSGYSDMAIGIARLFGFKLMRNFAYPYFSRDIAEFWRRWHISLSTWFRDYLYIPLGGSQVAKGRVVLNVFIIFVVSGFWHGANWTFIVWGALNAIYFLPLLLLKSNRKNIGIVGGDGQGVSLRDVFSILVTFGLTCLAWVFFRADDLSAAFAYLGGIFDSSLLSIPSRNGVLSNWPIVTLFILLLLVLEWKGRFKAHPFEYFKARQPIKWAVYFLLIFLILFNTENTDSFIYFQF